MIIVVGGALTFGATKAFFSDVETSVANVFTAGAIDLLIDNESYYNGVFSEVTSWTKRNLTIEKFFNFDDVKPGDYGEDTISIHVDTNDAYMCADITLTSNNDNGCTEPESLVDGTCGNPGVGEGELAMLTNFIWWADDGDNVLEDDEMVISGPAAIGNLSLNEPYPITLADSQSNIWNEGNVGGPVTGATAYYIGKAWCFGDITPMPLPQDGFGDAINPAGDNNGNTIAGEPADGGFQCAGAHLGNESQTDSLTADVSFHAVQARHNENFMCQKVDLTCTPEQTYATKVVDYSQGVRKNGTTIDLDRSNPAFALGAPQSSGAAFDNPVVSSSFFSLGFNPDVNEVEGGWIIVEFGDGYIVDGPGNDLRAWEVTGGTSYPVEKVKIEVSQDGTNWYLVASSIDRDAEADLASSGLSWAKYVRLTDVSPRAPFEALADGYDLDAFSALNCATLPPIIN